MLCKKLRINERNLDLRLSFLKFGKQELATLKGLEPWLQKRAEGMAKQFYDFQFTHEASKVFFQQHAEKRGIAIEKLRAHLESAQTEYMKQWGNAGRQGVDLQYFERRLKIGQLHNQIGLPQKWYIGSYSLYLDLVERQLRRDFPFRPWFRHRARQALTRLILLDIQAVSDGFLVDLLGELGDIDNVITELSEREDVSDRVNDVKLFLRNLLEGVTAASEEIGAIMDSLRSKAENLSSAAQQEAASVQQMNATLTHIKQSLANSDHRVRETARITIGAEEATGEAPEKIRQETASLTASMQEIALASSEIENIVDLINEIAFQTNLLALNASVEAARAGQHGRGFAVVASEVRTLSEKTKDSSERIKRLVNGATHAIRNGDSFVMDVAERIRAIAEDLAQQTVSISEITSAAEEIDRASQSNAREAEEIFNISEKLRQNTSDLRESLNGSA